MDEPHVVSLRVAPIEGDVRARTVRADGVIVGTVRNWTDHGVRYLQTEIAPDHRGRGIATRATRLALDTAELPVRVRIDAADSASTALATKLGFAEVARESDGELVFELA